MDKCVCVCQCVPTPKPKPCILTDVSVSPASAKRRHPETAVESLFDLSGVNGRKVLKCIKKTEDVWSRNEIM